MANRIDFTPAEGIIAVAEVIRSEDVDRDINEATIQTLKREIYQTAKETDAEPCVVARAVLLHVAFLGETEVYDA